MPGTQELTRRIKSIKSTRKITRAMQMVSAAKMRKAQQATMASRTYSELAWELIVSLRGAIAHDQGSPLVQDMPMPKGDPWVTLAMMQTNPSAAKIAVVIISSNKGLVGGFNTNLINQLRQIEKENLDKILELIVVGRKAAEATARQKKNIVAQFPKSDIKETVEGVYPLAQKLTEIFTSGEYAQVLVVYNHFVSTLVQKATVKQLLPFSSSVMPDSDPASSNKDLDSGSRMHSSGMTQGIEYLFEPSPELVINHLIPRILESQLYQAILESDASEHSARMVMMKSATDAAKDLIDDLTLTFNQLRQNKITTELSEITAGRIALEK